MKLKFYFTLTGVAVGLAITLSVFIFQILTAKQTELYFESDFQLTSVSNSSNESSDWYSSVGGSGYSSNIIFSILYDMREKNTDNVIKKLTSINNEENRFEILTELSEEILDEVYPRRHKPFFRKKNENDNLINSDIANLYGSQLFEISKRVKPEISSIKYADLLQAVIKILDAAGDKKQTVEGLKMLDGQIADLTIMQNNIKKTRSKESIYSVAESFISKQKKKNTLLIGSILTGFFGVIGFILSSMFEPVFKSFGENIALSIQRKFESDKNINA